MRFLYNKYGFILALVVISLVFLYNIFTGSKGSYMDHSKLIIGEALKELTTIPGGNSANDKRKSFESRGETECRRVAELLTGMPFPKKRPHFLRNTVTDMNLEIDCFCDELKLGIEYNGRQHYHFTPYFHTSKEAFMNGQYRDEMKRRLCAENGIRLIIVPYTVDIDMIEGYIRKKFAEIDLKCVR